MCVVTLEQRRDKNDEADLFEWRFEALMEAGYLPDQSHVLAAAKQVDVLVAERLLAKGCPRATALRLLL